jgi:SAM-dependent methyltransferase
MLGSRVVHHLPGTGSLDRVIGLAESLPLVARSFNAVLSFNAIHHFDLSAFLAEAARALQPHGRLIVYTRTPEQNRHTIWGQCFPHFAERETRLYTESTLRAAVDGTNEFESLDLLEMPWTLRTSLPRLLDQARSGAYSTFRFYSPEEFENALRVFDARVRADFDDLSAITAPNDHLLVLATRR